MKTYSNHLEYEGVPPVSNIKCYKDATGYFMIEADFGGFDYIYLSYDHEYREFAIEDPYLGTIFTCDTLTPAIDYFCEYYELTPEDSQYVRNSVDDICAGGYIASATETETKDFDVFMLMDYRADTGPDTMGMEGDSFDCLGKFFATDLQSAKDELASILAAHPELKDCCPCLYVTEYNEYFDSATREEQDEYGNPYDVENNVFADLDTLIEKCFDWDYINSWAQGTTKDDELPFPISMEDTFSPADDNFALYAISNTLDSISLDPNYSETIEDIRFASDPDSGIYTIRLYFWDGESSLIDIDPAELESQTDYNQACKLVRDKVDTAINEYGG